MTQTKTKQLKLKYKVSDLAVTFMSQSKVDNLVLNPKKNGALAERDFKTDIESRDSVRGVIYCVVIVYKSDGFFNKTRSYFFDYYDDALKAQSRIKSQITKALKEQSNV